MSLEEIKETLSFFDYKTEPKEHQWKCLFIGLTKPTWLFALDMGLGKTKLSLDIQSALHTLEGEKRALVSCPPIMLSTWREEIRKHSHLSCVVVEGTTTQKKNLLLTGKADLLIVSHTWLTMHLNKVRERDEPDYFKLFDSFDILFIDEAHRLMNPKTSGFKVYRKYLMNIPRRYLLTGTPIANNYIGVWALYFLLDGGATFGKSYFKFLNEWFDIFMVADRFPRYTLQLNKKQEFKSLFWKKCIRYVETDCRDLPEKRYVVLPLTMAGDQAKAYDALLRGDDSGASALHGLMRITGGTETKTNVKIEALKEILIELCKERDEQVIIWHWLIKEGECIETLCAKLKIPYAAVRGKTTDKKKAQALEDWRGGKIKILVANVKSLGIGITLTESNTAIFYSNTMELIDRKQAEKRIHRTGQKNLCTYIDLVCEDSIDEDILSLLRRAGEGFDDMLDLRASLTNLKKKRNL